jgi:hypothetical protein
LLTYRRRRKKSRINFPQKSLTNQEQHSANVNRRNTNGIVIIVFTEFDTALKANLKNSIGKILSNIC